MIAESSSAADERPQNPPKASKPKNEEKIALGRNPADQIVGTQPAAPRSSEAISRGPKVPASPVLRIEGLAETDYLEATATWLMAGLL